MERTIKRELSAIQHKFDEQAIKESKRFESYWHEDEDGIWCDNCKCVFYYDDNLTNGEQLFKYCPDCGAYMTNYRGEV